MFFHSWESSENSVLCGRLCEWNHGWLRLRIQKFEVQMYNVEKYSLLQPYWWPKCIKDINNLEKYEFLVKATYRIHTIITYTLQNEWNERNAIPSYVRF